MGCPIVMFMPGTKDRSRRSASKKGVSGTLGFAQAHVELGGIDPMRMLVELGPTRAPCDAGSVAEVIRLQSDVRVTDAGSEEIFEQ
jgi:hypothetical protein